jgi:hypothetical protein
VQAWPPSLTDTLAGKEMPNEISPYALFRYSIRSELTRKYYERRLRTFLDFIGFHTENREMDSRANSFAQIAKNDINQTCKQLISFLSFQKERVAQRDITAATLRNFVKSLKSFCDSTDLDIPWKKITKGLPRGKQAASDRAPSTDEIRKLLEYPDRRIKPIVLTMASSGIRLGAWDTLQWKHIKPFWNEKGEPVAAKIIVYEGDVEEYYSFITGEAYQALADWIDFRSSYGEKITGDSWLMRDLWQTTNVRYGARWGLATCPKKLKSSGIKRLLNRALWEQGLRQPLKEGAKRHEWKAAHGFRKFYKTRAEQVMKPINVEITMGHNIGVSGSYYRPKESEVLSDYSNAVDILTIGNDKMIIKKQVEALQQKNIENEYIIKGKLQEKDDQINSLTAQFSNMQNLLERLVDGLSNTKDQRQFYTLAKSFFASGILREG